MATSRFAVRLAALAMAGFGVCIPAATPLAHATEPSDRTKAAKGELDRLADQVDIAVEDYNQGRIELVKVQRAADRARTRVAAAQQRLTVAQEAIGLVAASAYRAGTGDQMLRLITTVTEPSAFLDSAGALDQVARANAEQLRDLRSARRELAAIQAKANIDYAAEQVAQRKLTKTRDAILASVSRQEKLVATFVSADERAAAQRAAAAERAAAERLFAHKRAVADAAAERSRLVRASRSGTRALASIDGAGSDGGTGDGNGPAADVPVTGRGAAAVRFAYAQIGKPYSWGADGPGSFDCSGLAMRAWGAAGVSLSHSSRAQYGEGQRISRSQLEPGDLVFFGSPIHHVGVYVGGGMMINAPQTGEDVRVRSALRGDYAGAVRPA